ncbi:hypothetical protein EDD21DRAFT_428373 [Dissophora ornata]|nr:hypothetical protein EDD21DRAFT_428373 [Dissophora ornata]
MIEVPVCACEGDYILSADELKRYFGVEPSRMGRLPEYLIVPRLNSTWNANRSKSTGRSWWDITGEVVAYKPLEWVPIVRERSTIPYNCFEIYGHFEASFTMSIGGGWKGLKAELSTTSSVEASYRTSTKVKEKGKIGDVVIKELAMGMCLRVQRVYERSVNLYLNNEAKGNSLTWDGPESWDELRIVSSALRDVKPLQFHPIRMSGTGHSDSLFLQAFPVFNVEKKLTDLHLVLSCEGWTHWFVYNGGTKTVGGDRLSNAPVQITLFSHSA